MIRRGLFALFMLVVLGAMTWPGYALFAARIEPYVLGLPFSLAWVVGWVILTFAGLVLFHATRQPGRE
jgi:TRAP-type C4-dicarboxylate transport system permease small subunit